MKYKATFRGREAGAIGIMQDITTTTEGETPEAARLALYDRFEHITGLTLKPVERVKFRGIDHWNRAVFRSIDYPRNFYGDIAHLWDEDAQEADVLAQITEADLCFFGNSFGCEPMGTPARNLEIVRS